MVKSQKPVQVQNCMGKGKLSLESEVVMQASPVDDDDATTTGARRSRTWPRNHWEPAQRSLLRRHGR